MHALYACGHIDSAAEQPSALPVQLASAVEIASLCSGGFGIGGFVTSGCLQPIAASATSSQDVSNKDAKELASRVRAAAFGWEHALVLHSNGSLRSRQYHASLDRSIEEQTEEHRIEIDEAVTSFAAGEQHSLAVISSGHLVAWGSNASGQLGTGDQDERQQPHQITIPREIGDQHRIAQVACGARHSCAITEQGALLAWGWCLHGQCGVGRIANSVPSPQLVALPPHVTCTGVSAGLGHSVACCSDGSTYAWGLNADGQLGLGDDDNRSSPVLVDALVLEELDVVKVACGARHTAFLTACSMVFTCGWGRWGQLGNGAVGSCQQPITVKLPAGGKVTDVACGWWHTLFAVQQ